MSMNENQKRQKAEAMRLAEHHNKNSTVDGSGKRDDSMGARLKDVGRALMGDEEAHGRIAAREGESLDKFYGKK